MGFGASGAPRCGVTHSATRPRRTKLILLALTVVVLGAIALDTKVVALGSDEDLRQLAFSPAAYGAAEFPGIQADVEQRAGDAKTLFDALAADKTAASEKYGQAGGTGAVFSIKLSGVIGDGKSGIYDVSRSRAHCRWTAEFLLWTSRPRRYRRLR